MNTKKYLCALTDGKEIFAAKFMTDGEKVVANAAAQDEKECNLVWMKMCDIPVNEKYPR